MWRRYNLFDFRTRRAHARFQRVHGFGAGVGAVAITAVPAVALAPAGASAGASAGKKDATNAGEFYRGFAVFTIAKGGLMYEATIAGQKFSYTAAGAPKKAKSKN